MSPFSHGELVQMARMHENSCVICGEEIPEGRMVCPIFERGKEPMVKEKHEYIVTIGRIDLDKLGNKQLVRCKDCKYYGRYSCELAEGLAKQTPESYCSYGERKEKTDE